MIRRESLVLIISLLFAAAIMGWMVWSQVQ
jgi:hypothetical protein